MDLSFQEVQNRLKSAIGGHVVVGGRHEQVGYTDLFEIMDKDGEIILKSLYDGEELHFPETIYWNCDDKYIFTYGDREFTMINFY